MIVPNTMRKMENIVLYAKPIKEKLPWPKKPNLKASMICVIGFHHKIV